MPDHSTDEQFLHRALDLARDGIGLASPNPYVGALIVDSHGTVAGTGVYTYAGVKHAEVRALEQAGEKARGGTLYINLEPHSHQGRTPACTDALIAAGIHRVVASMADPNPKVSGRGFEKLRAAGVQVEVGGLEAEARRLNENFARYIRHGLPFVTLKAAMTLDGKIALPAATCVNHPVGTPAGGWITGEEARAYVHQQRHQSDALMVGVGTILADDPLLTDRSGLPRRRRLLRVILDTRLRLSPKSRIVQSSDDDLLVYTSALLKSPKASKLQNAGVELIEVKRSRSGIDLGAVLKDLGRRDILSVLLEAGPHLNGAALSSSLVSKLVLFYAPKIAGVSRLPLTHQLHSVIPALLIRSVQQFGADVSLIAYPRASSHKPRL
jgi:diaminohydroxyphosphoribosylaminopyrimidine deaminase/5-amino-6-(5-phosphoribosylamino)uracil reductase